ncbi:MAG: maleylpyruvate isomerase family mycothiol-dependent enzyme [Propionibacteriaceae bacterium]
MTTDPPPATAGHREGAGPGSSDQLTSIRGLLAQHTQRLLGDTISIADEQWRQPSRLPGWSRGHVATHVARQADALGRLLVGIRTGEAGQMYPSAEARDADIEAGAGRTGLELQIDLDTSAEALGEEFEALGTAGAWAVEVELRGGLRTPARLLPLARLTEVVLHHVDLDVGYTVDDVPGPAAAWVLEWCALRLGIDPDVPRLRLHPDGSEPVEVGRVGEPVIVAGPANLLLGWIAGRHDGSGLTGADAVRPPSFG